MSNNFNDRLVRIGTNGSIEQLKELVTNNPETTHVILINCFICLALLTQKCGGCQIIRYCSKKCQYRDWSRHKIYCRNKVLRDHERMEITTRDPNTDSLEDAMGVYVERCEKFLNKLEKWERSVL